MELLLSKPKIIGYTLVALLAYYAYYSIIVVPENTIIKLKSELVEERKKPAELIDRINKNDANRTQEEINAIKVDENITFDGNGTTTFK